MATSRITYDQLPFALPGMTGARRYVRSQTGWNGDRRTPYTYKGYMAHTTEIQDWIGPYEWHRGIDAPNTVGLYQFNIREGIPLGAEPYYNRAYERFKEDAVGDQSSLGTFAAEWKESLGMINERALGLYQAARDLRRGRLGDFVGRLGVKPKRKHRGMSQRNAADNASGLWLEYWFGWAPTVSEIYTLGDKMQQPLPSGKAYGSAGGDVFYDKSESWVESLSSQIVRYKMGAVFDLTNPNLFLMNRLGLANPAQVAWELIPFSFVVDWCTDFGSYISSFSDWAGLEMRQPWVSCFTQGYDTWRLKDREYTGTSRCKYFALIRKTNIPQPIPNLQISANLGKSLTRTATAVSLLTQTLLGMGR